MKTQAQVVVVGGNFGGMTSACELKRRLKDEVEVTVISTTKNFLYIPSLIWVAFGRRSIEEISFPVEKTLRKFGIRFIHEEASRLLNDGCQHVAHANIFAVGLAAKVDNPFLASVPFGVPKTGYPTDEMAKIAVTNIGNILCGQDKLTCKKFENIPGLCVMDAGDCEVLIFSNSLFPPRKFAVMLPNFLGNFSKVFVEKALIMKYRNGWSFLP